MSDRDVDPLEITGDHPLRGEMDRIYATNPNGMRPFIGRGYGQPGDSDLRILAIGINPYDADSRVESGRELPERWARWWRAGEDRYFRNGRAAVRELGAALEVSTHFRGRQFREHETCFATNFIKRIVGHSAGKQASQLPPAWFEEDKTLWHREVDVLAKHQVLPHVVLSFGACTWSYLWPTFVERGTSFSWSFLRPCPEDRVQWLKEGEPSKHHVARYPLATAQGEHELLLVRLDHPSRGQALASLRTLLAAPDFRQIAGLTGSGSR